MPRTCTICTHERRSEIDAALLAEEPYRRIAARFGTSTGALQRHKEHLPEHLAKAHEAQEVAQADNLLEQVKDLQARALSILDKAETAGDLRTAVSAIREARAIFELLAKLTGELDERPVINLVNAPEWLSLRVLILEAVRPYPDAAQAVTRALSEGRHERLS